MFNYRFYVITLTLIGVIGKIREMGVSFEMALNPVGTTIKIIGIIMLAIFVLTPNDLLQSKES